MTDFKKPLFCICALLAALTAPLSAQEPWDVHLKLTAGMMNNAEDNQLGQNKVYGLAIAGAYPLTLKGHGVLEGGYKVFPTTTITETSRYIDDLSDIYFVSLMYRHDLWRNGIYLQGGLRVSNTRTVRDIITKGVGIDGKDVRDRIRGKRDTKAGLCFAVGYRLTDLCSVEVGASSASFSNLAGKSVSGTIFEIALCIHR